MQCTVPEVTDICSDQRALHLFCIEQVYVTVNECSCDSRRRWGSRIFWRLTSQRACCACCVSAISTPAAWAIILGCAVNSSLASPITGSGDAYICLVSAGALNVITFISTFMFTVFTMSVSTCDANDVM